MGFAIKSFFQNFINFEGRATRKEYWLVYLAHIFLLITVLFLQLFYNAFCPEITNLIDMLYGLFSLIVIIPSLSLTWRRLHDTGKSGGFIFLSLIPFIGPLSVLIALCSKSDNDNKYGPQKYRS